MKKVLKSWSTLLFLSVLCLSCQELEDDSHAIRVEALLTKCINVQTNVHATISYHGIQKTGTNVTFEVDDSLSADSLIHISASGYLPQNIKPSYVLNNAMGVKTQLVKAPTNGITWEDILKGQLVVNNEVNQQESGVKTSVIVPTEGYAPEDLDEHYSVAVYSPTQTIKEQIQLNDIIKLPIFSLYFTPHQARFEESATIKFEIEQAEQFDLEIYDGNSVIPSTIEGNTITTKLNSLHNCQIRFIAEIIDVQEGFEETTGSMNVFIGKTPIPYQHKIGFECSRPQHSIISNFLNNAFGTPAIMLSRNAIYNAETSSRVDYTIRQPYTDYTFKSKSTIFTARVYKAVNVKIESEYVYKTDFVYDGCGESTGL